MINLNITLGGSLKPVNNPGFNNGLQNKYILANKI